MKMSSTSIKSRAWCFTINNYTDSDWEMMKAHGESTKYMIMEKEVGESGTPHIQGYAYFDNARVLGGMKRLHKTAHWEIAKGTPQQNKDYCSKDKFKEWGCVYEKGELPKAGRRTDIDDVKKVLDETGDIGEAFQQDFGLAVRCYRGFEKYLETRFKHRTPDHPPTVCWLWGKAGVGKTSLVTRTMGVENVYIKDGTHWWNGYKQEQVIMIDDFDGKWPYRDLLRLLDRYPYQGQ